ncbi:MAG: hypothetical protein C4529_05280 [Deltaproteobacteria bacterium]|nr:MAG: hypothetical protein C4529_05280 [Deltaproteobacteria bacterium]
MFDSHFEVLNALASEFRLQGLDVTVDPDTICVGREQWDKYSNQVLLMLSAAPAIKAGTKTFYLFASEQYDLAGKLTKYSIKLCDNQKTECKAWELDTKRGQHVHLYSNSEKDPPHLPFEGSIKVIASEIMDFMRMF